MPAASIRARVRAEIIDEIKTVARRHLASDGANLSLRAVARDMGMVSSAVYRYFPSRDDLLTALIIDAYNSLGEAVEHADAAVADRSDLGARWLAGGRAVRAWALATPAEYALIYGSPVPGYAAPQDTVGPATRTAMVLVRILADGVTSGALEPGGEGELPAGVHADLGRLRAATLPEVPEPLLARGTIAWIHLFGAVSFELFGQLNNVIDARAEYFDHQLRLMAGLIGLPLEPAAEA
jgi:AcrR family transcriptional regulator